MPTLSAVCSVDLKHMNASGQYEHSFWVFDKRVRFLSDFALSSGSIVDIVSIDVESKVIKLAPSQENSATHSLVVLSHYIPLDPEADFELSHSNCEPVFHFEVTDSLNKFITVVVMAPVMGNSSVYGRDHRNDDRIAFDVSFFTEAKKPSED